MSVESSLTEIQIDEISLTTSDSTKISVADACTETILSFRSSQICTVQKNRNNKQCIRIKASQIKMKPLGVGVTPGGRRFKKTTAKQNFYSLIELGFNGIVQVCIGKTIIYCSMLVLQFFSDIFEEFSTYKYVIIPEYCITPEAFINFYNWCFYKTTKLTFDNVFEYYRTSQMLGADVMLQNCWNYFIYAARNERVALEMFAIAQKQNLDNVMNIMLPQMKTYFLVFIAQEKLFEKLKPNQLLQYIDSTELGVISEADVLFAAVRWINYDWVHRKKYAHMLGKAIRFPLLPVWYLTVLMGGTGEIFVDRLVSNPKIKDIIEKSLILGVKREHRDLLHTNLLQEKYWETDENCPSMPVSRLSVTDKKSHVYNKHHKSFMSYKAFNSYLNLLRRDGKEIWNRFIIKEYDMPQKRSKIKKC